MKTIDTLAAAVVTGLLGFVLVGAPGVALAGLFAVGSLIFPLKD